MIRVLGRPPGGPRPLPPPPLPLGGRITHLLPHLASAAGGAGGRGGCRRCLPPFPRPWEGGGRGVGSGGRPEPRSEMPERRCRATPSRLCLLPPTSWRRLRAMHLWVVREFSAHSERSPAS